MPSTATVTDEAATRRLTARRDRHQAQRVVWRETKLQRVAFCGRVVADRAAGVGVRVTGTGSDARAGFSGLQTCGSVWACPVCSEKINARRQADLQAGIEAWMSRGGAVIFGTLTLQHSRADQLVDLLDAISPAWNRTTSGAGVAWNGSKRKNGDIGDRARFGIRGYVRLLEVKHGQHGWHPHVHFLLFLDHELSKVQRADLSRRMFGRWVDALQARGLTALEGPGIDLRPVYTPQEVAWYFAKGVYGVADPGRAAFELTGSQSKKLSGATWTETHTDIGGHRVVLERQSRTPFQILEDLVRHGDRADLELWHEWERSSKGRRQLTWSRGLRKLLALDNELSDQEAAEADELDGVELHRFTPEEWKAGGWTLVRCDLLEAAEIGPRMLRAFIADAIRHRRRLDSMRT